MRDELLAQIVAQPDDPEPYLVYADWLAESVDPLDRARGEWIVAEVRGLDAEAARLEAEVAPRLLPLRLGEDDRVWWRWGFVHRAVICDPHFRRPKRPPSETLLAGLLDAPAARVVRTLTVYAHDPVELSRIAGRIAAAPPPALRALAICERFPDSDDLVHGIALDEIEAVWALAIERLALVAGTLTLGAIVAPTLERVTFEGGLFESALQSLAAAQWPRLTAFAANHGRYKFGAYKESGMFDGNALCEVIATSPWSAQLVDLDLSDCELSDAGVRRLFDLPKLATIDLSDNVLDPATLAEARARWRLRNAE